MNIYIFFFTFYNYKRSLRTSFPLEVVVDIDGLTPPLPPNKGTVLKPNLGLVR